jgi:NAD(P)-dependent dehydrogenase (short-subunit alcohol dehydrogenase family)
MIDQVDMSGKVCMVTGATHGIGEATVRALAGMGAEVIATARDAKRGKAVVEAIRAKTGNPNVRLMLADFASLAAVRALAEEFRQNYSRLDVLVNNAGGIHIRRTLTVDGYEMTFAVNHLAPFLLTNLLLDLMKASAPSRIVNVSSDASLQGTIHFEDLHGEQRGVADAYQQSKLANVLFTVALAKRLEGTGVTANALHPGWVGTNIGANNGFPFTLVRPIILMLGMTAEKGAETQVYLATSPEVAGVSGGFFFRKKPWKPNPLVNDDATVERLWRVSEQLTGLA